VLRRTILEPERRHRQSFRAPLQGAPRRPRAIAMTEYFYRYRPIKAVLDEFHELENQEIYFSTTDEFNDPMEGFKDLFWRGDEIVWRNFLKHYILCSNCQLLLHCCGPVRSNYPKKHRLLGPQRRL
jgi:hypothetical protein